MDNVKWMVTGSKTDCGKLETRGFYGACYNDFGTAKAAFRDLIRSFSAEDNYEILHAFMEGFDKCGYESDEDELVEEYNTQERFRELLFALLRGEDTEELARRSLDDWGTNYMFSYHVSLDEEPVLRMEGDDDGPCNGVSPVLYTNAGCMGNPAKHYFCIAEPRFGDEKEPSAFAVDLLPLV